jgi:hypothetical protein
MRCILFGVFAVALCFMAFPASSVAAPEPVTLLEDAEPVDVEATVKLHSYDLSFTGRSSGFSTACERSRLTGTVTENPGARILFHEGGEFKTEEGDKCPVENTGGRIEARVSGFSLRSDLYLQREGIIAYGWVTAGFALLFYDRELTSSPIAYCPYEGTFEFTGLGFFTLHADGIGTLQAGSAGACESEMVLFGGFQVSRRDGTPIQVYPG